MHLQAVTNAQVARMRRRDGRSRRGGDGVVELAKASRACEGVLPTTRTVRNGIHGRRGAREVESRKRSEQPKEDVLSSSSFLTRAACGFSRELARRMKRFREGKRDNLKREASLPLLAKKQFDMAGCKRFRSAKLSAVLPPVTSQLDGAGSKQMRNKQRNGRRGRW
jgi:hypothetical protein